MDHARRPAFRTLKGAGARITVTIPTPPLRERPAEEAIA